MRLGIAEADSLDMQAFEFVTLLSVEQIEIVNHVFPYCSAIEVPRPVAGEVLRMLVTKQRKPIDSVYCCSVHVIKAQKQRYTCLRPL